MPLRNEKLIETAAQMKWFHALDLGDFQTSGRFPPDTPQNRTLFPVIDLLKHVHLMDRQCLDIGTAHGLISFGLALRGAQSVTATDVMGTISPPWALARSALNLDVEYSANTTFENILTRLQDRQFELIACAGVIYHMLNPFDAILKCRKLLRPNGLLVIETAYLPKETRPVMDFNPSSGVLSEIYTYWMPSKSALLGMLRLAGFDPLAIRHIDNPDRIAVIARNVDFQNVRNRADICKRMHETGLQAAEVTAIPSGTTTDIAYYGPEDDIKLDWPTYDVEWPPHPTANKLTVGQSPWLSKNKNF